MEEQFPNIYKSFDSLNLGLAYGYVLKNNPSNNLPYHNFGHLEKVAYYAYLGAIAENLPPAVIRDICLAGLFHDFNHSGGKLKDSENVALAKAGYEQYVKDINDTDTNPIFVKFLIDITEYPYTVETSKLTIQQKILRDADMIFSLNSDNYMQDVVIGLAKEFNIEVTDFLKTQADFVANMSLGTEFAKNMFAGKKDEILDSIRLINQMVQ